MAALADAASTDELHQYHNDRDDQENMNEPAYRGTGNEPQGPQDKQDDGDGKEHDVLSFG